MAAALMGIYGLLMALLQGITYSNRQGVERLTPFSRQLILRSPKRGTPQSISLVNCTAQTVSGIPDHRIARENCSGCR